MIHTILLGVFIVAIGFILIGLIYLSILNHSHKKRQRIEKLRDKEYWLKNDLRNNYIDQMVALNVMLMNGAISEYKYLKIVDELSLRCRKYDMDNSFIALMIKKEWVDINAKSESVLRMANTLSEQGKITESEYEKNINKALDVYKKDK
jgi:hypothetical protein